jgi:3-deoxy-manno-octulosonate cytidylyltransferase (CMP-KDO synthetase)
MRDEHHHNDWIRHHRYYKHIGIYAYRHEFLQKLTSLTPGSLEKAEKLEQLRVLENGYKIRTVLTDYHSLSVDTKEDLDKLNHYVREQQLTADKINGQM